jgi:hypothetical protein
MSDVGPLVLAESGTGHDAATAADSSEGMWVTMTAAVAPAKQETTGRRGSA